MYEPKPIWKNSPNTMYMNSLKMKNYLNFFEYDFNNQLINLFKFKLKLKLKSFLPYFRIPQTEKNTIYAKIENSFSPGPGQYIKTYTSFKEKGSPK
jgi:hypothetical protein